MSDAPAQAALQIARDGAVLRLSGTLQFGNAATAYREVLAQLRSGGIARIEARALQGTDSAALACLLAWRAQAQADGHALAIAGLPENLHALAGVSGVEGLIATQP